MVTTTADRGRFISLEGIEGAGKSTALDFVKQQIESKGIDLQVTREPGGTEISEAIRKILLQHHKNNMSAETELLLAFAGRKQHFDEKILPALNTGKWVLSDRFTDASYAYQGGGRGIEKQYIQYLEEWLLSGMRSDIVLLLDLPVELGLERAGKRSAPDRFEAAGVEFFERVRRSYLEAATSQPDRYAIIDATQPLEAVKEQLLKALKRLPEMN